MSNYTGYMFPHIEPSSGKHGRLLTSDELDQQRGQYLTQGIPAGFGKHRAARYSSSYRVVER